MDELAGGKRAVSVTSLLGQLPLLLSETSDDSHDSAAAYESIPTSLHHGRPPTSSISTSTLIHSSIPFSHSFTHSVIQSFLRLATVSGSHNGCHCPLLPHRGQPRAGRPRCIALEYPRRRLQELQGRRHSRPGLARRLQLV
uniref:Uncharacterized protein n=1 Tax=Bionectria ochroleuca TaxID=29856 RepID=A0A8H7K1R8_BIOOC